ncbi:MAG: hypothetical protein IJA61_02340 [Clostridia bacterium]|nr:hypothetical protein [Clostridia bacterium]
MKFLDKVKLIKDNEGLNRQGIFKGMIGRICDAEIRDNCFHICFEDQRLFNKKFNITESNMRNLQDDIFAVIKIEDVELVESFNLTDEEILQALPKNNINWWCKVEDGYILNLKGDKKNKTPYNYNS